MPDVLRIAGVRFAYPGGASILDRAELAVPEGSYVLVRGPSGAGKSTLLRLLCRLEAPDEGTILFRETPYEAMPPETLRRSVAYVHQMPQLISGSVRDNLLLPYSFKASTEVPVPDEEGMRSMLDSLLLDSVRLDDDASSLSVGQAQRVCFARTIMTVPDVLLLDEPTASLDAESAALVYEVAARLFREGRTVMAVSHAEASPGETTHVLRVAQGKAEFE